MLSSRSYALWSNAAQVREEGCQIVVLQESRSETAHAVQQNRRQLILNIRNIDIRLVDDRARVMRDGEIIGYQAVKQRSRNMHAVAEPLDSRIWQPNRWQCKAFVVVSRV